MTQKVKRYFSDAQDFDAKSVFVATWNKVGYFNSQSDRVNTFQTVIISNSSESYLLMLYPENGIQWIQSLGKIEGLPDALAQAGFMSSDRRVMKLPGSGSEHIFHLDKMTNTDQRGQWFYRIGRAIARADASLMQLDENTCQTTLHPCPPSATCIANPLTDNGICCVCRDGFIGNGRTCFNVTDPVRVAANIFGNLNGQLLSRSTLHAYVVVSEGRQYTAISGLDSALGTDAQTLFAISGGMAWLFAKHEPDSANGFMLTGGHYNRTIKITFPLSEHKVKPLYTYSCLQLM